MIKGRHLNQTFLMVSFMSMKSICIFCICDRYILYQIKMREHAFEFPSEEAAQRKAELEYCH